MAGQIKKYTVIDTETNEQFCGSCSKVADKLGISTSSLNRAEARKSLYRGRYKITKEDIGEVKPKYIGNMSKLYNQFGQIHRWYVKYRTANPKEGVVVNE